MHHRQPIEEQVVVITGASSGIGLATARLLARKGARVVLASRNPVALSDADGKPRLTLTVDAAGNPRIEFLDEAGKVIARIPEK